MNGNDCCNRNSWKLKYKLEEFGIKIKSVLKKWNLLWIFWCDSEIFEYKKKLLRFLFINFSFCGLKLFSQLNLEKNEKIKLHA